MAEGSSNVRYNYDETTSTFSPVLITNKKHAIYRTNAGVGELTIVSSNGDAINSTWTYENGIINTISSPVNILSSVIENYLSSGPLTINAGNTTVSSAISSTSSNAFVLNANSTLINTTPTTTVNAAITNAGSITINTGTFNVAQNITTTSTAAITISAANQISTSTLTRRTISTQGGNITLNADNDANGVGWLDIDDLTLNPGAGNLIVRGETFNINGTESRKPYINGTGSFTFESNDTSFGQDIGSNWFVMDQDANGISGLTIGKSGTTVNVYINTALTVAGPISVYGGYVEVSSAITSSATGDILLKGIVNSGSCVNISGGITKSSGTGTLTMQGHGRVNNTGTITTSGTGVLNVIFWSDYDGDNVGGGSTLGGGSISTNGGHVWMGGSNSNGGSYTWNGLAVGDGPSIGASNSNCNALDLFGPITTSGGDVLLWASTPGCGTSGIVSNGTRLINAGSGDITFIAPNTSGAIELTSTGVISLVPHAGSYASALTFGGTLTSGNFSFNTSHYNGMKINSIANVGGLTIGKYEGMLSSGTPLVLGNTSNISFSTNTNIAGPISIYGGDITVSQNLTSTLAGADILLQASGAINLSSSTTIQTSSGDITFRANSGGTAVVLPNSTTGAITLNSGSSLLSNGGNITLGGNFTGTQGAGLYAASNRTGGSPAVLINNATLTAAGGNINIYGKCTSSYDDGVRLQATITTTGSGTIGIYGDAWGGYNGTEFFSGISFFNEISKIETENGNVTLEGILTNSGSTKGFAIAFYRSPGLTGQTKHIQILSKTGDIQITADRGTSIGQGIGHSSWGHIYFGSPSNNSYTASGNIKFTYSNLDNAANNGFKAKTTGPITYEPVALNFDVAQSFPVNSNYVLADGASSLTIGKPSNTANITMSSAQTVAGPISIYGGTITLDANLTATNNGDISLYTDNALGGLSVARTINASGSFNYISRSDFFSVPVTYPITNLNLVSKGLLIGKPTNTANITFANATTVAGPITAYGGTITLNANLTTTNNGSISLYTDNALGGLSTARTLTAAGAFKYIPRTTAFTADVTYPITNLTATSAGLTIGKTTNDKNITITQDVTGPFSIELYGANVNINSNLTTTGVSAIMYLKGNTNIAAGKSITSGGNFTHDGNITFKSDATGTAAFGVLGGTFTTVSGLATTERYIPAKRAWRLLTAPLKGTSNVKIPNQWQGVNGEGLLLFSPITYQSQNMTGYTTGGGSPNIWKYNNGWQAIPNLSNENLYTSNGNNGFLVFATGASNSTNFVTGSSATTLKPQGQLITGDVSHSLTANQYQLIGNPYASPLNTETLVDNNPGAKVWMVDPSLGSVGGYYTYDGTEWTPTTPNQTAGQPDNTYIQSGQGFFVRSASAATFTISESHKIIGNSNTWFDKSASVSTTSESKDKIRVLMYKQIDSQWQLADGILAVNSASGNNAVDATDANKMTNFNENIMFRNGSTNLSIEYSALPQLGYVQPIRLTGTTVQPYELRLFTENYSDASASPVLEDTVLGTFTPIPTDGSMLTVPFTGITATSTSADQRFRIVYQGALSNEDFMPKVASIYPRWHT